MGQTRRYESDQVESQRNQDFRRKKRQGGHVSRSARVRAIAENLQVEALEDEILDIPEFMREKW